MVTRGKLHRSSKDKMLFGVSGGLAEYFDVDPVLVRLGWVFFAVACGLGILFYLVMAIIVPKDDNHA